MTFPSTPAPGTDLCALTDLTDPGAREFRFGEPPRGSRMFVVRRAGVLRGYRNLCPHFGLPLNIRPDEFLDRDGERLICRMHYALFRIEDGMCERGPCAGQALQPVPLAVVEGRIRIAGAPGDE